MKSKWMAILSIQKNKQGNSRMKKRSLNSLRKEPDSQILTRIFDSPVGPLELFEKDRHLIGVQFQASELGSKHKARIAKRAMLLPSVSELLQETEVQLNEYFQHNRHTFTLPIQLEGTEFQKRAWQALIDIPYGETASYSQQAEKLGGKTYSRAVGQANHNNPIVIIVPCHRVIGKNGSLTGFGGGLDTKAWLISHESGQSQYQF